METLTQQEINYIKTLYRASIQNESSLIVEDKVRNVLSQINNRYQPLLDKAENDGDFELRKQLIEQMTTEAKTREEEIRLAS